MLTRPTNFENSRWSLSYSRFYFNFRLLIPEILWSLSFSEIGFIFTSRRDIQLSEILNRFHKIGFTSDLTKNLENSWWSLSQSVSLFVPQVRSSRQCGDCTSCLKVRDCAICDFCKVIISLAARNTVARNHYLFPPPSSCTVLLRLLKVWIVQELSLGAKNALRGDCPNCLKQTQENYNFQWDQLIFYMFKGKGVQAAAVGQNILVDLSIDLSYPNVLKIRQTNEQTDQTDNCPSALQLINNLR